jgi:hypothetical protein
MRRPVAQIARAQGNKTMAVEPRYALNAICPYFTMFPLEYPMRALDSDRLKGFRSPLACDPYCGRGTTIFAARLRGIRAVGIDVEPVAVAIAKAKLACASVREVMELFDELNADSTSIRVPQREFWKLAYHEKTLATLCRIRRGLMGRRTDAAAILRAVMMGALHGPRAKTTEGTSYLSNQMPRTFASKPEYSIAYWKRQQQRPPDVDVRSVVQKRAARVLAHKIERPKGDLADIRCQDSRQAAAYSNLEGKITHVVTSPPYYGLKTYAQDQWLRGWFLGRDEDIDYRSDPGLDHGSPELFATSLSKVWNQIGCRAADRIEMFVRFGGISSRHAIPDAVLRKSLEYSRFEWLIVTRHPAYPFQRGKRQALQMTARECSVEESDYVIRLR